jgi:hypothetical protein
MMLRCALLDDYQGVARASADWARLSGRVEIRVFREHIADRAALARALDGYEIIVAMRERTPFDRPAAGSAPGVAAARHHRPSQRGDRHCRGDRARDRRVRHAGLSGTRRRTDLGADPGAGAQASPRSRGIPSRPMADHDRAQPARPRRWA